jgi:predicted site-specific integrase-resolvase
MSDAVLKEILQEIKDVKSSQLRMEERLGRVDVEYLQEKTGKHDAEINRLNKLTQF